MTPTSRSEQPSAKHLTSDQASNNLESPSEPKRVVLKPVRLFLPAQIIRNNTLFISFYPFKTVQYFKEHYQLLV
jgi:hypothetical protein